MPKAIWNGAVIAESDHTIKVEGKTNPDGAWYYPAPFPAAAEIKATSRSGTASGSPVNSNGWRSGAAR
jgi:uncharacterized protein (DUF427 family)